MWLINLKTTIAILRVFVAKILLPFREQETENREQRIDKSFKSFIYFFMCCNLCADCYIFKDLFEVKVVEYLLGKELK